MTKKAKGYKELNGAVVLYADNYINDLEGEKIEDLCALFLERGVRKIVIDFSSTDIINSIGVSILIGIIEKVKDRGGTLFFSGLKRVNHDIFSLVGISRHVDMYSTEEDAVKALGSVKGTLLM